MATHACRARGGGRHQSSWSWQWNLLMGCPQIREYRCQHDLPLEDSDQVGCRGGNTGDRSDHGSPEDKIVPDIALFIRALRLLTERPVGSCRGDRTRRPWLRGSSMPSEMSEELRPGMALGAAATEQDAVASVRARSTDFSYHATGGRCLDGEQPRRHRDRDTACPERRVPVMLNDRIDRVCSRCNRHDDHREGGLMFPLS